MRAARSMELGILGAILGVYILLCFIIAGLNYGYAPHASAETAKTISFVWHFYENWIKTFVIVVGAYLTLRIVGKTQRSRMRRMNLYSFIVFALIVHILGPIILGNEELYLLSMPLPWISLPLQLGDPSFPFYQSRLPFWGVWGISAALIFHALVTSVVFVGTLLYGRRWQCSSLCLFNGFAAEAYAPVFPLIGKKKPIPKWLINLFKVASILFLVIACMFSLYWILKLTGVTVPFEMDSVRNAENMKYLSGELLVAIFFWIFLTGRGYCYYCPLGTVLGIVSKIAGQEVTTDKEKCVGCKACDRTCPMSINVSSYAIEGTPMTVMRCVGCGHCVDRCPQGALVYSTHFTRLINQQTKIVRNRPDL